MRLHSAVPPGLSSLLCGRPSVETLGYSHCVPPGRRTGLRLSSARSTHAPYPPTFMITMSATLCTSAFFWTLGVSYRGRGIAGKTLWTPPL